MAINYRTLKIMMKDSNQHGITIQVDENITFGDLAVEIQNKLKAPPSFKSLTFPSADPSLDLADSTNGKNILKTYPWMETFLLYEASKPVITLEVCSQLNLGKSDTLLVNEDETVQDIITKCQSLLSVDTTFNQLLYYSSTIPLSHKTLARELFSHKLVLARDLNIYAVTQKDTGKQHSVFAAPSLTVKQFILLAQSAIGVDNSYDELYPPFGEKKIDETTIVQNTFLKAFVLAQSSGPKMPTLKRKIHVQNLVSDDSEIKESTFDIPLSWTVGNFLDETHKKLKLSTPRKKLQAGLDSFQLNENDPMVDIITTTPSEKIPNFFVFEDSAEIPSFSSQFNETRLGLNKKLYSTYVYGKQASDFTDLRVASWNIKWLGHYKSKENVKLAKVAVKHKFDILVIQEQTRPALQGVWPGGKAKTLGNNTDFVGELTNNNYVFWDSEYKTGKSSTQNNSSAAEFFSIFYNPLKVELNPLLSEFLGSKLEKNSIFTRVPFKFVFIPLAGTDSIPFSLISVHLEPNASGKKQRAKEFEGIVKYIQKETEIYDLDFPNCIVLGDTNIEDAQELKDITTLFDTTYNGKKEKFLSLNPKSVATSVNGLSAYDQVFIGEELSTATKCDSVITVVDLPTEVEGDVWANLGSKIQKKFFEKYSDHNPVYFEMHKFNK